MEINNTEVVELDYFRAVASVFVNFILDGIFADTELLDELYGWEKNEDYRFLLQILQHNKWYKYPDYTNISVLERETREDVIRAFFADKPQLADCLKTNAGLINDLLVMGNVESHNVFLQQEYRISFIAKMKDLMQKIKPYCKNQNIAIRAMNDLQGIDRHFRHHEMED